MVALVHEDVAYQVKASFSKIVMWDDIAKGRPTTVVQNIPLGGNPPGGSTGEDHPRALLCSAIGTKARPKQSGVGAPGEGGWA
jgi:hypothetical protein